MENTGHIIVVPDEWGACPRCGAYWGNPTKDSDGDSLDFPNRNKVDQYWRCYNPKCTAGYYDPKTQEVVEDKLPPEETRTMYDRIHREVTEQMKGRHWETTTLANGVQRMTLVDDE